MSTTLPQEYLKLNWLGSTGTQYIDTDYRPNGHTEIDVSWYWNLDSTSYSRAMFGVDETGYESISNSYYTLETPTVESIQWSSIPVMWDGDTIEWQPTQTESVHPTDITFE